MAPKTFAGAGGADVHFLVSAPAQVTFVVERVLAGKLRRGRCVVTDAARKSGTRCIRYDFVRRSGSQATTGANTVRLDASGLPPGRYRLRAIAVGQTPPMSEGSVRFRVT
jgi:hypothetical protein